MCVYHMKRSTNLLFIQIRRVLRGLKKHLHTKGMFRHAESHRVAGRGSMVVRFISGTLCETEGSPLKTNFGAWPLQNSGRSQGRSDRPSPPAIPWWKVERLKEEEVGFGPYPFLLFSLYFFVRGGPPASNRFITCE